MIVLSNLQFNFLGRGARFLYIDILVRVNQTEKNDFSDSGIRMPGRIDQYLQTPLTMSNQHNIPMAVICQPVYPKAELSDIVAHVMAVNSFAR